MRYVFQPIRCILVRMYFEENHWGRRTEIVWKKLIFISNTIFRSIFYAVWISYDWSKDVKLKLFHFVLNVLAWTGVRELNWRSVFKWNIFTQSIPFAFFEKIILRSVKFLMIFLLGWGGYLNYKLHINFMLWKKKCINKKIEKILQYLIKIKIK